MWVMPSTGAWGIGLLGNPALALLACLAIAWEGAAWGQVNYATPYTFQTIAGNAGYGTADGVGSAARFYWPQGVAGLGARVKSGTCSLGPPH